MADEQEPVLGFFGHHHDDPKPPVRVQASVDAGILHTHSLDPLLTDLLKQYLALQLARVPDPSVLADIATQLSQIQTTLKEIQMTDQEVTALLARIDTTTTNIGTNVQTIADTDQTISNEIDALLAATPVGTPLSDANAAKLQGLADRLQASSDASDQQVTVLKAIAAKGQPVVPVAPPPPVIPTP